MTHKKLFAIFAMAYLTSLLALGQQNDFADKLWLFSETKPFEFEFSPNGQKPEISENAVYQFLFFRVFSLEKEAAKQKRRGYLVRANALSNFLQKRANLNDDQAEKLRVIANSFFSETARLRQRAEELNKSNQLLIGNNSKISQLEKQYEELPLLYRERLRESFGQETFERFTRFVFEQIKPKINATPEGGYGYSEVSYDVETEEVSGYSATISGFHLIYCDPEKSNCPHAYISATLSSDLHGELDNEDVDECGTFVEAYLFSPGYDPEEEFCVNGLHSVEPNDPYCYYFADQSNQNLGAYPSEDCVTTPQAEIVSGVSFQQIATDDLPIDENPNAGGGQRIFPDDRTPNDQTNRRRIRVLATLSERFAGRTIYFRNFDLDDPSNDTVIDPNGNMGDDNNGMPQTGQLHTTSATTNSMGVATVEFSVTMQPGDNFAIAASTSANILSGINVNGTELRTAGGQVVDTTCGQGDTACRTEMLTVWRRLHIEVDSMGVSDGNFVLGTIPTGRKVVAGATVTISVNPSPANPLEVDRFRNGRLFVVGGNEFDVLSNTTGTVTIRNNTSEQITIPNNIQFQLYDDDDFNDNDGTTLDGDTNENISMPDTVGYLESSDDRNTNVFADAYVRPVYDIGDNNDNTQFTVNLLNNDANYMRSLFDFDLNGHENDSEFWAVYLLGAYQDIIADDGDPHELETGDPDDAPAYGVIDESYPNGQGTFVFLEVGRPREYPLGYGSRPVSRAATAAHEIGHLFGGQHAEEGLMSVTRDRTEKWFRPMTIRRIRLALNP